MNNVKTWIALAAVAAVAVLAGGWFLLVSPKHAEATDLRQQAETQRSATGQLQTQLNVLKAQAKDLPSEQAKLAAVAAKLPDQPSQPALLRALAVAADNADVELLSVSPGAVAPLLTAASTAGAAATATASTDSSATATESTATASTPAAATSSAGTLMQMPVTISIVGGYFQAEQYLAALEDLPRAFRVTTVNLAPGSSPVQTGLSSAKATDGSSLLVNITGMVFITSQAADSGPVSVPAS